MDTQTAPKREATAPFGQWWASRLDARPQTMWAQLPTPTLAALAAAARGEHPTPAPAHREDRRLHSEAERRLYEALTETGLSVQLKQVIEGYELDLAVTDADGRWIDVECDGTQHTDPRGRQRRQDLVRDQVLERLGWQVLRVPVRLPVPDPSRKPPPATWQGLR